MQTQKKLKLLLVPLTLGAFLLTLMACSSYQKPSIKKAYEKDAWTGSSLPLWDEKQQKTIRGSIVREEPRGVNVLYCEDPAFKNYVCYHKDTAGVLCE